MYYKHFIHSDRPLETTHTSQPESSYKSSLLLTLVLGAVIGYLYNKRDKFSSVAVDTNVHTQQNFTPVELTAGKKLSRQEKSFSENASYMCQGVLYMSPAEFLKVVTKTGHDISEDNTSIIKVKLKEANKWLSVTSKRSSNQDRFLRDVWSKGFLSYPDYRLLVYVHPISSIKNSYISNLFLKSVTFNGNILIIKSKDSKSSYEERNQFQASEVS